MMENRPELMTMDWFRNRLRQLIAATGLSDRAFGNEVGKGHAYIYKVLNGVTNPKWDDFFYMVWMLRISPRDFFDEGLDNPPMINSILSELREMETEEQQDILNICRQINKKRDTK